MSDAALLARFRSLAAERLAHLDTGLLALEQGTGSATTLDAVMREIHTLKGESRMLGLLAMNRVAHRTEDVLQHARRTQTFRDAALLEVAFAGLGLLGTYLDEPEATIATTDEPRAKAFEARVAAVLDARGAATAAVPPTSAPAPGNAPMPADAGTPGVASAEGGAASASDRTSVVRVTLDLVDDLTRTAGVLGLLQARIERTAKAAAALEAGAADALRALRDAPDDASRVALLGRARALHAGLADALRTLREGCFAGSLRQQRLRDAVSALRLAAPRDASCPSPDPTPDGADWRADRPAGSGLGGSLWLAVSERARSRCVSACSR